MAKKTTKGKLAVEIAAGLAAAGAAAAAGYYFYGSKQAKTHRKIAAKWATSMKNEVIKEAKRAKKMSSKDFAKIVDTVAKTYVGVRSVNAADVKRAASELKANWEMVQREAVKGSRKVVSRAKVVGKRATTSAKKTVKKAVKKAVTKARKTVRKSR